MQTEASVIKLDLNLIVPNKYQPRKVFDEIALNSLAESIKNYGILNPILVRKKDDVYEIIAGERRFRAAQKVGLTEVPVIVKNVNEQQMAELALIENLERQNLSSIEEAKSYEEIMRIGNQTQESLAKKLGKSQPTIANKIRLLSLPIEIQDALSNRKISERHARSLISIKDKEKQLRILNRIITEKLTVKETEQMINEKEFTEKEIKKAIDDIMKSLSLIEEPPKDKVNEAPVVIPETKKETSNIEESLKLKKHPEFIEEKIKSPNEDLIKEKEEKEDDNMNNGNFFPNFDNNAINNNTSLNMMNEQSMNTMPMAPSNEMVMPTLAPQMPEPMSASTPVMDNFGPAPLPMPEPIPMANNQLEQSMVPQNNSIPDFNQFNSIPTMDQNFAMDAAPLMAPQMPEPMSASTPVMDNFGPAPLPMPEPVPMANNQVPSFGQFESSQQVEPTAAPPQMLDTPLFNPEATMAPQMPEPMSAPIPVMDNFGPAPLPMPEPVMPVENTGFEVPFIMPTEPVDSVPVQTDFATPAVDKLSELQNYLSANGYSFKTFNNETENCIIIEMPKNY